MGCCFCTHRACSPESNVELPVAVPVTHIFHLVMEAPTMPMGIGSTRAHLVAIRMGAETLAHLWSVMVTRLGLNDLHNASEEPHRCFWKEVPSYDVSQPMRTSFKILIGCSPESCGHGVCGVFAMGKQ